jgi:hypothetical protein
MDNATAYKYFIIGLVIMSGVVGVWGIANFRFRILGNALIFAAVLGVGYYYMEMNGLLP